jgi:serine/threonine protein kinase
MRETADSSVGLVGGRYEIVRPLASGGMATVYIARHHLTRQEVALKIVASVFAQDAAGVARFLREVSVASRIQHDGVVKVFDAGFDEALRSPYLAMELLDGGSLAEMLSARKVDQEAALRLVLAFLDPLAAAHDAGVVHRDLKPENVFVTRDGRVKLLDFGVARDLRGSRATMEGTALGTVYYMAPEQAVDARSVGAAADVYAVGVTLYQILCGIFPFDGSTPHAVLIRANRETAVPAATRATWAHPNLTELVDRCLAKSPADRPADAAALRGLLAALLDDAAVVSTVRGREVNPATFLSTPPPPALSGEFLDPFAAAATTPPPMPAAPRPVTEVAPPEVIAPPPARGDRDHSALGALVVARRGHPRGAPRGRRRAHPAAPDAPACADAERPERDGHRAPPAGTRAHPPRGGCASRRPPGAPALPRERPTARAHRRAARGPGAFDGCARRGRSTDARALGGPDPHGPAASAAGPAARAPDARGRRAASPARGGHRAARAPTPCARTPPGRPPRVAPLRDLLST